jgi:hypothetical protein
MSRVHDEADAASLLAAAAVLVRLVEAPSAVVRVRWQGALYGMRLDSAGALLVLPCDGGEPIVQSAAGQPSTVARWRVFN